MKHEIDLKNYSIHTDLALESVDYYGNGTIQSESFMEHDMQVTQVVLDEEGSKKIGKKVGTYITIEFSDVTDHINREHLKELFSKQLKKLMELSSITPEMSGLVIGLGNAKSTPDSLGPLAISHIIVTNHLFQLGEVEEGFRKVWAFVPGVKGETGIETSDLIQSVITLLHPDFLVVVDALSSGSLSRVNTTIQMSDSGISPGSGIGNKRKEISRELYGIPVLSIGVPTVVDAITIVSDTIGYMEKHFTYTKQNIKNPIHRLIPSGTLNYLKEDIQENKEDNQHLLGMVGSLDEEEIKQLLYEVLSPIGYNFMVTPKEVDFVMEYLSKVIGEGINMALHDKVTKDFF